MGFRKGNKSGPNSACKGETGSYLIEVSTPSCVTSIRRGCFWVCGGGANGEKYGGLRRSEIHRTRISGGGNGSSLEELQFLRGYAKSAISMQLEKGQ